MYYNRSFLNRFSPTKSSLLGFGIWVLIFLSSSLELNNQNIAVTGEAVSFLTLSMILFLIGIQAGRITILKRRTTFVPKSYHLNYRQKLNLFYIVLFLASFALSILLIDKFLFRGISLFNNMFQNREELAGSYGFLSILAAVLTPLSMIPIFLIYQLQLENKKKIKLLSFIILVIPAIIHLLLGSRSGIVVILLFLLLCLFYFKKIKLTLVKIIVLVTIGLLFFMVMTHIFVKRTEEFTPKPYEHIIHNSGVTFTLKASPSLAASILDSESVVSQYFYLSYLNFTQYYLHGVYEFFYLYENFKSDNANGKYTFFVYYKLLNKIIINNSDITEEIISLPPRKGIYTTFLGPIFIDFGWLSLLFMFLFGVVQTKVYLHVKKNKLQLIPLYFYFIIINLFIPVFNFINGAQGLYLITSFILFAALFKLLCSNIIVYKDKHSLKTLRLI